MTIHEAAGGRPHCCVTCCIHPMTTGLWEHKSETQSPCGEPGVPAAGTYWSALMLLVISRWRRSQAPRMTIVVGLLWEMAAGAGRAEARDADQQVFTIQRRVSGTYSLPVVGRYMVDCQGWARACVSPFYVLSNPLQICVPPLIYEWKLLPVVLQEGTLTRESDWLFVLSIIREYIQFTLFIPPGPSDKWWGGLF